MAQQPPRCLLPLIFPVTSTFGTCTGSSTLKQLLLLPPPCLKPSKTFPSPPGKATFLHVVVKVPQPTPPTRWFAFVFVFQFLLLPFFASPSSHTRVHRALLHEVARADWFGAYTTEMCGPIAPEARGPRSRCRWVRFLLKPRTLACRWPPALQRPSLRVV